MGNSAEKVSAAEVAEVANKKKPEGEKKLKACCACPETKRARDACIIENGEANCKALIEAHRECMKKMGFDI